MKSLEQAMSDDAFCPRLAWSLVPDPYSLFPVFCSLLGGASLLLGAAALVKPREVAWLLGAAEVAGHRAGNRYYRILGVRDLILGAGLLAGAGRESVRPWLLARAASDLLDAATIGVPAVRQGRRRQILTGMGLPLASAGLSLGLWLLCARERARHARGLRSLACHRTIERDKP
jgi:hypothetical protein